MDIKHRYLPRRAGRFPVVTRTPGGPWSRASVVAGTSPPVPGLSVSVAAASPLSPAPVTELRRQRTQFLHVHFTLYYGIIFASVLFLCEICFGVELCYCT